MIWRGPFIALFGAACLYAALAPIPAIFNTPLPMFMRVALGLFGLALLTVAAFVTPYEWRQRSTLRHAAAQPARFTIQRFSDSEGTIYTARIEAAGRVWLAPVAGTETAREIAKLPEAVDGEVWLHARTGEPMGLAHQGQRIRIIPLPQKVKT